MPRDERRPMPRRVARTRMLLKAPLGWIGGFPLRREGRGVRWWTPPGVVDLPDVLGPRELRRASRALLEIRGELLDTLPTVFPQPERWLVAAEGILEAAGRIVHHGEVPSDVRPPADREIASLDEVRNRHRRLAPLLDAVAWSLWPAPWQAKKTVRWIDDHAALLAGLFDPELRPGFGVAPIELAMTLLSGAAADGIGDADGLLRALVHPQLDIPCRSDLAVRTVDSLLPSKGSVKSLKKGRIPKVEPLASRRWLAEFVQRWAAWDRPRRRSAARIWKLVFDPDLFSRWALWWHDVDEIRRQLETFDALERTLPDPGKALRAIERRLRRRLEGPLTQRRPQSFDVEWLLQTVVRISDDGDLLQAVRRALDVMPPTWSEAEAKSLGVVSTRPAFVWLWDSFRWDYPPARLAPHIDAFRRLVAAGGARALAPWAQVLVDGYSNEVSHSTPDDFVLDRPDAPPLDSVPMVRAATELYDVPAEQRELIFRLCLVGAPVDQARRAVAWSFERGGDFLPNADGALREALPLASNAESLGRILLRLSRLKDSEPSRLLLRGARRLGPLHAWAAIDRMEKDPAALIDLARRIRVAVALGCPADVLGDGGTERAPHSDVKERSDQTWIGGYPESLRQDLAILADSDDDAEGTARKILRREIRDPLSLEQELQTVTARAERTDDPAERADLAARAAKLESWLATPPTLPASRLERLRQKLRRAAASAALEKTRRLLDRRLHQAFHRRAEAPDPDGDGLTFDILLEPEALLLVDSVLDLSDRAARRFGLQLLLLRCGPAPWDLRDHPDNLEFRRRMVEAGVDLELWLDGDFRRTFDAGAQALVLQIERDPLQVLRMGAPFGTCLSPWDFNFFSAVANAVAVDKQVVFARDAEERLVGRCLLALGQTVDGDDALIAFFPYCHDSTIGFRKMMGDYAAELAETMGVPLAIDGKVARLVCPDWYDDGPFDLRGDLAFLADGSPFRESLAGLDPDRLADAFRNAMAPRPVDAHSVASVLPFIAERPELVTGLAQYIERLHLPAFDRLRAATLARKAGRDDLAGRWVASCAGHLRELADTEFPWWERTLGETLADLAPSLALRLLRETRPAGLRSWRAETHVNRLWIAARAHRALHRRSKARELFRRIADQPNHYDDAFCAKARRAADSIV